MHIPARTSVPSSPSTSRLGQTIPGALSAPPSPSVSWLGQIPGGPASGSPSLRALELDSEPEVLRLEPSADPVADPPAPAAAPGPAGARAAALGALVAGAQQFLSQLMGTVSRSALQAGLVVWAGGAWRQTPGDPAEGGPPPGPSAGGGAASSEDVATDSDEGGAGNRSGVSNTSETDGVWPPGTATVIPNVTIFSNQTIFDNRSFTSHDTDPGDPLNFTALEDSGTGMNHSQGRGDFSTGPAGALAGLVASSQAGWMPSNASLPIPQTLPGDAFGGAALPGYDVSAAALAGPVALASTLVAVSILLSACRVYELGRGAMSALTGRCRRPESTGRTRLGQALTGTLGLAAAATPVLMALGRDAARAHETQEGKLLAVWMLINLAGRTCQHLLRDATTQLIRPHMPALRYQVDMRRSRGSLDAGGDLAQVDLGSPAFSALHLNRRVLATRTALTFISYWAGIYFCLHHVLPAIRRAGDFANPVTLHSQVEQGHSFGQVLAASVPGLLTSALIEGLDSLTSSLSTSIAAGSHGARIELAPGRRPASVARDFLDHFSVRIFNALFTVDMERAGNALRGIDRDTEPGMFLQGFALGLTDIRGFFVQFGQHGRALALAAAQEAEPASQSEVLPAVSTHADPVIIDESGHSPAQAPQASR